MFEKKKNYQDYKICEANFIKEKKIVFFEEKTKKKTLGFCVC